MTLPTTPDVRSSPLVDAPAWVDDLDLHAGAPEASMGTRSLDLARWLLVDDEWLPQREQARSLLHRRRTDVLAPATTTLAFDAARELGVEIDRWLAARHRELADREHAGERDPVAAARLRVAEDLCIVAPGPDGWLLESGSVCFPSYWRLHQKVGRPLSDVHEPVPGYAGALAARVEVFLGRLGRGQGGWRRNWSVHDVPDLYLPAHVRVPRPTPVPAGRWLRSEYQTLRRLPDTGVVVFTIRTQQVPVEVLASRPDRCAELAAALRGWSPAQRRYKGGAVDEPLLAWLDAQAARA